MVTPASLYILRSFLKGSIETLVRHAFTLAACACCAACCSADASPRPRPAPPARATAFGAARAAGPAPTAAASLRRRDPGVALDRAAHQLDGADPRFEDVA